MTLCPADEAAQDPSFAAYRARLIDAVQRKDETTLRTMISPDIRTTFGAANGIANFEANWTELAEVLRLGGTMRDGMFWAPYVYSRWPDEIDAFEHVAAIGDSVPVRQQPNATAPIVTTLHWSIVRVLPNAPDGWRHVKTNDGVEGYVAASGVRSPIAHRAGFAKVNGEWKLTAFVAGD
ncbi:MAG TPA: SH3 domain-containing protein [Thermoanaerobaculia bacterium]|nr:SH3 domain-containing protein [Thermoanaerobaculia bacterium]